MCVCVWIVLTTHTPESGNQNHILNHTHTHTHIFLFARSLSLTLAAHSLCRAVGVCLSVYTWDKRLTLVYSFLFFLSYVVKKFCRLLDCCSQINSVVLKRISTVTNGKESRYTRRGNETLFFLYNFRTCIRCTLAKERPILNRCVYFFP